MNTPVTATSGLYMGCLEKASFQPSYMNPMAGQEVRYYEHYPNAYSHPITAVLGEDGIKVIDP